MQTITEKFAQHLDQIIADNGGSHVTTTRVRPPASAEDVAAITSTLRYPIPACLASLLLAHDGEDPDSDGVAALGRGLRLLSSTEIIEQYRRWQKLSNEKRALANDPGLGQIHDNQIPFAIDEHGTPSFLDALTGHVFELDEEGQLADLGRGLEEFLFAAEQAPQG